MPVLHLMFVVASQTIRRDDAYSHCVTRFGNYAFLYVISRPPLLNSGSLQGTSCILLASSAHLEGFLVIHGR